MPDFLQFGRKKHAYKMFQTDPNSRRSSSFFLNLLKTITEKRIRTYGNAEPNVREYRPKISAKIFNFDDGLHDFLPLFFFRYFQGCRNRLADGF